MAIETAPAAAPESATADRTGALLSGAAALTCAVLAYWSFARTPVEHTSERVHAVVAAGPWLIALSGAALAAFAAARAFPLPQGRAIIAWARALPSWAIALVVALAGSYVAARVAIARGPATDYWPALALWAACSAAPLAALLAPHLSALRAWRIPRVEARVLIRSEVVVVLALTAVALVMRLVGLSSTPPLVHPDEEAIGLDAWRAAHGQLPNFFSVGWGANPAFGFLMLGELMKPFGATIVSLRVASALWGAAAIPMVYLLLREMFDRPRATVGALFLLGYHLHLHFSRVGLNVVWDTPTMAAAMWFAYRASRDGRRIDFAAAGAVCGSALYLYHGTRVVPVVIFAYFAYVAAFRWRFARRHAGGLVLALGAFAVVAMPLTAYYLAHQQAFWQRIDEASIFQSGYFDAQRDLGRSATAILWDQTRHAFGGWVYYRDRSPFVLYPESSSLVRGLAVVPLLAGIAYAALHIDDRRYALLIIAFVLPTFIGGALTLGPPNAQRLFSAVPSVIALITVGIWQLARLGLWWNRSLLVAAAIAVAAGLATSDAWRYYDGAQDNTRWGSLQATVAARYIRSLPGDTRVYWYGAPTVTARFSQLTLRERHPIEMFDAEAQGAGPVATASPSAYVFLAGQDARLGSVMAACPGGSVRDVRFDATVVVRSYELSTSNTCAPPGGPPDAFARAVHIASTPTIDFAYVGHASVEDGEPQPACARAGHTIWYTFTPDRDGDLSLTTDGSAMPTVLAVYTGSALQSLSPAGCAAAGAQPARLSVSVRAGTPYAFQVGVREGAPAEGTVRFAVGELAPSGAR